MDSVALQGKQLRDIYRAGTEDKPGKYYFADERKIVPGQSLRKEGKCVDNPDFAKDFLHLYNVVSKPAKRTPVRGKDNSSFKNIRESEPSFTKKLNMEDINFVAVNCGWKLSTKAIKALQFWGKGCSEIKDMLVEYKASHSDCNYIDYDADTNQFQAKWKHFPEKTQQAK